ncbi:hypothetical protein [Mycobacteroides abscessus]|uniref:hypothetical protein n=1 Tax=Mycobacteroides abscessus TaxID=36809 RepID=UPI000C265FFB|nr:hypothetical protein [Mycobacteroides abscessus]
MSNSSRNTRRRGVARALLAAASAAFALTACTATITGTPQAAPGAAGIQAPTGVRSPADRQVTGAAVTATPPAAVSNLAPGDIYPGAGLTVPRPDLSTGSATCTAGWLVILTDGRTGVMSAGHCQEAAGGVSLTATGSRIGTYMESKYQGTAAQDADAAVIVLDPGQRVDMWAMGTTQVTAGVATVEDLGNRTPASVCYTGATTGGGAHCGPLTDIDAANGKMHFKPDVPSTTGDSGGPVWVVWPDGKISAVGTLLGHDKTTGVVEAGLLEPWLKTWNLKVRT